MTTQPKTPNDRQIWDRAMKQALNEPHKVPEITDNRQAIRASLRESRRNHTVRVRSVLP